MDGDTGVLPLEADPRPPSALFVGILRHVFVLLEDRMDVVGGDAEAVSDAKDVADGFCARSEVLVQVENALFEIVRMIRVRLSTRCVKLRDLAAVPVLFGELMDSSPTDVELLGNVPGVHVVINNTLTDPGDIVLVKLHFAGTVGGEIMATKSLAYSTDCRAHTTEINEWVADSDEYPEIESLLQFQQNSNEFIPLYQYLSQIVDIEREDNRRKFFCHAYGYIIDRSERDEFTSFIEDNWVTEENIGLSELRGTPSLTDVFLGEYPWHPSARYQSRSIDESPTDATKLAVDLNWESEYDTSTQGAYYMLVSSSEFYNEFELEWNFDNCHLIDRNSELEIFDPTSLNKEDSWSQSTLLASKKPLLSQLESKQKTIVWSILGEKNVLGWSQSEHLGYVRIRGVYWIEDGEITGVDEAEFVESGDSPSGEAHSVPEDGSNVNVDFDGTDDFELVVRGTLEDIEGIGPKKAEKLRKAGFEDLPDVQGAARDELLSVEGIGPKLVDRLQETSTLSYLFKEVDSGKFQSN